MNHALFLVGDLAELREGIDSDQPGSSMLCDSHPNFSAILYGNRLLGICLENFLYNRTGRLSSFKLTKIALPSWNASAGEVFN